MAQPLLLAPEGFSRCRMCLGSSMQPPPSAEQARSGQGVAPYPVLSQPQQQGDVSHLPRAEIAALPEAVLEGAQLRRGERHPGAAGGWVGPPSLLQLCRTGRWGKTSSAHCRIGA